MQDAILRGDPRSVAVNPIRGHGEGHGIPTASVAPHGRSVRFQAGSCPPRVAEGLPQLTASSLAPQYGRRNSATSLQILDLALPGGVSIS